MSEASNAMREERKRRAAELTSYILHKHYCENDVEALVEQLDEPLSWFGTGEYEYGVGRNYVAGVFRTFAGKVPKCNLSGEEYDVIELSPDIYLCTGRLWIETDPSTQVYVRVHQRTTMVFRWRDGVPRCCHINISNPYIEMVPEDVGFPTKMARHSYEYLQEQIEAQKKQIAEQTAELSSIYNTVPCIITRWLRTKEGYRLLTFNHALAELLGKSEAEIAAMDWPDGFCGELVEEDAAPFYRSLQILQAPGDHAAGDYRVIDASGQCRTMHFSIQMVGEDERGQIIQRIAFDITLRVELEKALEQQSYMDTLTGLYNRNKFNQMMMATDERERLGLACFDINGLKQVNDLRGHSAGDELIRRTAHCINGRFPGQTYRIGGDEFVVIVEGIAEEAFREAVRATCADIEQTEVHISVGHSWRARSRSLKEQLDEADRRMYEVKAAYYRSQANDRRRR